MCTLRGRRMETALESYRRRAETSRLMDGEEHGYHRFDAWWEMDVYRHGQPDKCYHA